MSSGISSVAKSYIFPIPKCSYDEKWDNFVKIPHKGGFMPAFMFKCQSNVKTTIVYSHGNAEDIGHCYSWLDTLCFGLNVNVLAYDYDGYGLSDKKPSENACYDNLASVLNFLKERNITSTDIVLYGRSLGTGPSVEFASKQHFKGLVLESPYTSIFGVVSECAPNYSCCLNPFNNETKIDSVECPIIIFHGSEDTIIDLEHSKKLLECSQNCRLIELTGGGHNNLSKLFEEEMIEEMNTLL